ncbi:MAG: LptF/LptG family permease [Elusimicrobia bacterium]|nr:LptF/LptG family permease [Elusimicrobiota bacterium]
MKIPIFQRYILKVFIPVFLLSTFVFTALFIMVNFIQIINRGILSGFSFYFLSKALIYLIPNIFSMVLPLAFLMATLLSLGQLSGDGEIVAMRAGGFSFKDILMSLFACSLSVALLLVFVNNWIGPVFLKKSNDYVIAMADKITKLELRSKTFQKISDWEIYSDEVDNKAQKLKNIKLSRIFKKSDNKSLWLLRIDAKEGNYRIIKEKGLLMKFRNGRFNQADFKNNETLVYGTFKSYETLIPFFSKSSLNRKLYPKEMQSFKLLDKIQTNSLDQGALIKYKVDFITRFTMVLSPIIFFLIGAPLGLLLEKKGKAMGFSLTLLIIFIYYGISIMSMVLAKKHEIFFPWILYIPPILGFAAGVYIWRVKLYLK